MSSTPNDPRDPTAPDYGASQPPPPGQPAGQGGHAQYDHSSYGQPPYGQPTGQPQYGQPAYGQYGDASGPQDRPAYGTFPPPGENVWQQPQYGQVPQWQSNYGQGGFGQQMVTAPRGARLGSFIIDWLIVSIPSWALMVPLGVLSEPTVTSTPTSEPTGLGLGAFFLLYVVLPIIGYIYYGYFGGIQGATIGQRAVGLKVVGDRTGEPIGFWWYVLRMLVLGLTGSICLLGYLSIFFDSSGKDRGWHDLAARSRVVRAN